MKCENCSINIGKEFKAAIAKNLCPACGKPILSSGNLAFFVPLCDLIAAELPLWTEQMAHAESIEKLATLIITNFNVSSKSSGSITRQADTLGVVSVEEDVAPVLTEDGVLLSPLDKSKSKEMLQKLRDEALSEALSDREDIAFSDEVLLSENPVANAELLKRRQKEEFAREALLNGGKGMFRRQ